jgi:hypothetical protein
VTLQDAGMRASVLRWRPGEAAPPKGAAPAADDVAARVWRGKCWFGVIFVLLHLCVYYCVGSRLVSEAPLVVE